MSDTACPPPAEYTDTGGDKTMEILHGLDKKLNVVCNKVDNLKNDVSELKVDIREVRNENRNQNKEAASHVPWKYLLVILAMLISFIGGSYAYTHFVETDLNSHIKQHHMEQVDE